MRRKEMDSETELRLASASEIARLLGRALILRCPNCGKGPVLEHWFKLRVRCGNCGLRLERGEHDYLSGSILFSYALVTLVFAITLVTVLVSTWPNVPWEILGWGLPLLIAVLVVALFPFSKLIWLAFDLMLRPVTPEELEWHRDSDEEYSTEGVVRSERKGDVNVPRRKTKS